MGAFKNSPLPPPPKPPGGGTSSSSNLAAMKTGGKKPSAFQTKMQEMNATADAQARGGNMAGANQTAAKISRMESAYNAKRGK